MFFPFVGCFPFPSPYSDSDWSAIHVTFFSKMTQNDLFKSSPKSSRMAKMVIEIFAWIPKNAYSNDYRNIQVHKSH